MLRWCQDHFAIATDDRQRPAASSGGVESDPALTIGDDVFDSPRRRPRLLDRDDDLRVDAADIEPRQPAEDDDLIVDDCDVENETIHCDDLTVDEADLAPQPIEPPQPARPAGLESLLRDFVADFQRLALEWQTA